ncbi:hypothetical protein [Microbacterium phyllosphaerae]|uniref:hypothetical protein n=1 Tax=Microbacterium phyllosphaerae TaxID=124798 RepID=UPI003D645B98
MDPLNRVDDRGVGAAGLNTTAARLALLFVWGCGVASGIIDGAFAPLHVGAIATYAALLIGAIILTYPQGGALDTGRACALWIIALGVTVAPMLLPAVPDGAWLAAFPAYLLGLMIARGNVVWGVTGNAVQALVFVLWAVSADGPLDSGLGLAATPVMTACTGLAWHFLLRSAVAREQVHRSEAARSALRAAIAKDAAATYRNDVERVRREASGSLTELHVGRPLDPAFRTEITALEGSIRDRIRSPSLQHPLVIDALDAARRRGVRVSVLVGAIFGPEERPVGLGAARELSALLATSTAGTVVISSDPRAPGIITVVLTGAGEDPRSIRVDDRPQRIG